MEVRLPFPLLIGVVNVFHSGFRTFKFVDCSSSHIYNLCARFKEENQGMGSHDRTLCERGEDSRAISLPVP